MKKKDYQKGERSKRPLAHLLDSYAVFWKHIIHLPKLFLVDFLFFAGFVLITNFFLMDLGLIEKVMEIQQIISQLDAEALAADSWGAEGIQRLLSQKEALTQNFNTVIALTALLILSFYALWVILQSISLHLTHKVVHEKKHRTTFSKYLFRFSIINLIWLGIAAGGTSLIIKLAITTASSQMPLFRAPSTLLFKILLLAIGYFALVSYELAGRHSLPDLLKRMFIVPVTHASFILPIYLAYLLKAWLVLKAAGFLGISFIIVIVAGVSLNIIIFIWAKLAIIHMMRKIDVNINE